MKPVMYLIANKGLGMSPGKLAAQVAHAAVEAYRLTTDASVRPDEWEHRIELIKAWYKSGHAKIVLEVRDTEHLLNVERYLKERGYEGVLIIDEGRTEIAPHTPTVLGMPVLDKDDPDVQFAFNDLRTYRERPEKKKGLFSR